MHLISVQWDIMMLFAVGFMCSEVTASHSGLGIVSKKTPTAHCANSSGIVTQRYTKPEVILRCEEIEEDKQGLT